MSMHDSASREKKKCGKPELLRDAMVGIEIEIMYGVALGPCKMKTGLSMRGGAVSEWGMETTWKRWSHLDIQRKKRREIRSIMYFCERIPW